MSEWKKAEDLSPGERVKVLVHEGEPPKERVVERVEPLPYGLVRIHTQLVGGSMSSHFVASSDWLIEAEARRVVVTIAGVSEEVAMKLMVEYTSHDVEVSLRDMEGER